MLTIAPAACGVGRGTSSVHVCPGEWLGYITAAIFVVSVVVLILTFLINLFKPRKDNKAGKHKWEE